MKNASSKYVKLLTMCFLFSASILADYGYCANRVRTLQVSVMDIIHPSEEERLAAGEKAETIKESDNIFKQLIAKFKKSDLSDIKVTLRGPYLPEALEKITDKDGHVAFEGLPPSVTYEVTAQKKIIENGNTFVVKARALTRKNSNAVFLYLRTDWVTLKGRVIDAKGSPAEGAHIKISPLFTGSESAEQHNKYPSQVAISKEDGTYELPCVKPLSMEMAASYIACSNAAVRNQQFFFGLIYADKKLALESKPPKLRIPLISENILTRARRYNKITNTLMGKDNQKYALKEQTNVYLPESKGDVIFLPDIILEDDKPKPADENDEKLKD